MQFKDLIGLSSIVDYLTQIVREDKIPHALLFHGREGTGKYALALALSQYIVCKNRQSKDSCGECSACKKAARMIHPDIHFVFPVIKKNDKKRDETVSSDFLEQWRSISQKHPYFSFQDWTQYLGAGNSLPNINTRETHEIIKKLGYQTFESDYKILFIWMPEYLGKEGNRLLKIIEEPTANTFIFLIAEDLSKILGTILSRTQMVYIPPFTDDEVASYISLVKSHLSDEQKRQLVTLANGNLSKIHDLQAEEGMNYSEVLLSWIRKSYKSPPASLLDLVDHLASSGRTAQKDFLQYGLHFFREYLFYLYTGIPSKRLTKKEWNIAEKMKSVIDEQKAEKLVELLNYSIIHLGRNAHPKITFMADSMAIGDILRGEEVEIFKH